MAIRYFKNCDIARPNPHNYGNSLAAHAMMVAIKGVCDKAYVYPWGHSTRACVLPAGHGGCCYPCPLNFQLCQGAKCPNSR